MKAAQISGYGHADVLKIADVDKPVPRPDQVLVEVHAASINPFDTKIREGMMRESIPLQFPVTLGGDIAGVVADVGSEVEGFKVGDEVYGQANAVAGNSGAFAEFAATAANQIAKAPSNTSFVEAAALPLVGVSALQVINGHMQLKSGQKIFIHGGAGGIGTIAIQVAKHLGAYVVTTATGEGVGYVKQLGADEVIDYKTQSFEGSPHEFDAIFDAVGGQDFAKCIELLKPGGVGVSMVAHVDEAYAKEHGVRAVSQSTKVTTADLDALRELVEAGVVTPHVDKTYPLDKVREAFEAREAGTVKGKVVLVVKES